MDQYFYYPTKIWFFNEYFGILELIEKCLSHKNYCTAFLSSKFKNILSLIALPLEFSTLTQ